MPTPISDDEFRRYAEVELLILRQAFKTRAQRFREAAAETHAQWRLQWSPKSQGVRGAPLPVDCSAAPHLLAVGIGDLARLHLTRAYLPIIHTLGRIERNIDRITDLSKNVDPFKPKKLYGL